MTGILDNMVAQWGAIGTLLVLLTYALVWMFKTLMRVYTNMKNEFDAYREKTDEYMRQDRIQMQKVIEDNTRAMQSCVEALNNLTKEAHHK